MKIPAILEPYGFVKLKPRSKIPIFENWQSNPVPYTDAQSHLDGGGNYGVIGGHKNLVVIDADDPEMVLYCEENLPPTFTVETPKKGRHYYLQSDEQLPVRRLKRGDKPLGEIRGAGGQVVGPGSIHPDTGTRYEVYDGVPIEKLAAKHILSLFEPFLRKDTARAAPLPARITGGERNSSLTSLAGTMRHRGASAEVIEAALLAENRTACDPPLPDDEVKGIAASVAKYEPGEKRKEGWWPDVTQGGKPRSSVRNAAYALNTDTDLTGLFQYNLFAEQVELRRTPPWTGAIETLPIPYGDDDAARLRVFLANKGLEVGRDGLHDAVTDTARLIQYNPVLNYLTGITWDGEDRLDNWLTAYGGAEHSAYTREVGRILMIAACARVDQPGCKYDTLVILEGPQGRRKSEAVRVLGGPWHAEISLADRDKDTVSNMAGKWIIEVAEMTCFTRREVDSLKAFISTPVDRVRLPYARYAKSQPRSSVFIGTINPGGMGYLADDTGNRRFLPVAVRDFDLGALLRDRDQLFAEAWARYKKGEKWYITDEEVLQEAERQAEARESRDAWQETIDEWMAGHPQAVRLTDVWAAAFKGDPGKFGKAEQMRIARCLRKAGYARKRQVMREGEKGDWWDPPGVPPADEGWE